MNAIFKMDNGFGIEAIIIKEYDTFYYVKTKDGFKLFHKSRLIKKSNK